MSDIIINFNNNTLIGTMGVSKDIHPQKSKDLKILLEKHLPKFEIKDPIKFHFNQAQLQVTHQDTTCTLEDFKTLHDFIDALHSLAPDETIMLEYNVHGIKNDSGQHCWVASAAQLAYNLFPDRLDSFLPRYEEITSSTDFAQDFLNFQGIREGEPQEVLSQIVDTSIDPVNIKLQERRLSNTKMIRYYDADMISNTLLISAQETTDFTKLLESTLKGASDKETDTYLVTEFRLNFPQSIPHLSFDLRNCAQSRSLEGRLERQHITNIPLDLDEKLLGVPCSLHLQGAILHIGGSDEKAGNHYVTIFQKKHPVTSKPQWFLANDSRVAAIPQEKALELLPLSTHLYYGNDPHLRQDASNLDHISKHYPQYEKAQELQNILKILLSLRIEEKEPKSWLESLSDSFHGCDAVVELEDAMTKKTLLDIQKKLLPQLPVPSSFASPLELSFLQRKLIVKATQEYKILKAKLEKFQLQRLENQLLAKESAKKNPSIFEKISIFARSFFEPDDYSY